jgi:acetolactate synthase-1/2/3 large subunit
MDYAALAKGFGVAYNEIACPAELDAGIRAALCHPGPVLTRVVADYGKRPIRWIDAASRQFMRELCPDQKIRFLARIGSRALHPHQPND